MSKRALILILAGPALLLAACSKDDPIYTAVPDVHVQEQVNDTLTALQCAPNPASAQTRISFRLARHQKLQIDVLNRFGQLMTGYRDHPGIPGYNELILDVSAWPQGIYVLRVSAAGRTYSLKFVKA